MKTYHNYCVVSDRKCERYACGDGRHYGRKSVLSDGNGA